MRCGQTRCLMLAAAILFAAGTISRADDSPDTMTGQMIESGKPPIQVWVKGPRGRSAGDDWVMISDEKTGEFLEMTPSRQVALHTLMKPSHASLRTILTSLKAAATQPVGQKQIDGRMLSGFVGIWMDDSDPASPQRHYTRAWLDPATKLFVRIEDFGDTTQPADAPPEVTLDHLQFNVPLDDSLFSMKAPDGYQVTEGGGLAAEQLQPPPSSQQAAALILRPGIGIDDLKFGATRQQVIAALGPPESTALNGLSLAYPSRGLSILIHPVTGLTNINAYAADAVGWNAHDFSGKLATNLHIGSTRQDVEAALGKPDQSELGPLQGEIRYKKLGLEIGLLHDRVSNFFLEPVAPANQP